LFAGVINDPTCYKTCDELPGTVCSTTENGAKKMDGPWVYDRKWGACSSACPVSVSKDPHLHLPHGGRADFRGKDGAVFNLLSAKDVTLNVLFEESDFAWATRLVHGTKMAAAYWVFRTEKGSVISIEYKASRFDPVAIVREEGHREVHVRPGQPALQAEDVEIAMLSAKALTVVNKKWRFTASSSPYPFGKKDLNKDQVLLDVAIQPLYNVDADVVAPHGIIGQAYDGDNLAVDGKIDSDKSGESTTAAQAEGAIEGTWEDYIMASPFATAFEYSRFDATAAPHRDVSKLTGEKKKIDANDKLGEVAGAMDLGGDPSRKIAVA